MPPLVPLPHVRRSPVPGDVPLDEADAVLLGVPFDGTVIARPLQRHGPTVVRAALEHVNRHLPDLGREVTAGVHDAGDVQVAPGSFEETDRRVRAALDALAEANPDAVPLLLGGEHTISLSAVRARRPGTVVSFDAHTDLWDAYEGVTHGHATWLFHAKKETDCDLVLVGARAWPHEMEERMEALGVHRPAGPDEFADLVGDLKGPVHVTLDMDVFDPAYAPEVGFPEPSGLTPEEVFARLDAVLGHPDVEVGGLDVVEVATDRLGSPTASLAAHAVVRMMAHL